MESAKAADSRAGAPPVRRLTLRIQSGVVGIEASFLGARRGGRSLAVSPDGTRVVLVASSEGSSRLYVRALNQAGGQLIDGTDGASAPFWSPDGRWLAFFATGKLRKIPAEGGRPTTVCDVIDDTGGASGAWGPDGTIIYALPTSARAGLMRVSADGGTPEVFTTPDPDGGGGHGDPSFTVDGRAVLFVTRSTRDGVAPSIMLRSLATRSSESCVEERPSAAHRERLSHVRARADRVRRAFRFRRVGASSGRPCPCRTRSSAARLICRPTAS